MKRLIVLGCVALSLVGCGESVGIRTGPPGAKVFIDDGFVCVSPCAFETKKGELTKTYALRLEKEHYAPVTDTINTRVSAGRIVGGVFTLGISLAFRGPRTFAQDAYHYELKYIDPEEGTHAGSSGAQLQGSVQERLEKLQNLFDRGLISEQEYKRMRSKILDELAPR